MSNPWLVIPTLGNRPSINPLVLNAGMPAVVIWTSDETGMSETMWLTHARAVLRDEKINFGRNIHRWWNQGIDYAMDNGADVVVVCNDDVYAEPGELRKLADAVSRGAILSYVDDEAHARFRVTSITGWCFALNPAAIRPDEDYEWWWGDNDLELRAERLGRVERVKCGIRHLRTDFRYDVDMTAPIMRDRALFNARWAQEVGAQ